MGSEGEARAVLRRARTAGAVAALRDEIAGWMAERARDPRFARFSHQLRVLNQVLARLLDALDAERERIAAEAADGVVYERCRGLDRRLIVVRRLFDWYAVKYDQRQGDRPRRFQQALLAADEVVRSCWSEPFAALARTPPTGPLPYIDREVDAFPRELEGAFATVRVAVPPALRSSDELFGALLAELPIPTIALPEAVAREGWWLVLAAHETGHHVQRDLGVEEATRHAVRAAVARACAEDPDRDATLASWAGWSAEAFADAYSVLMVGPAATWAIDELQHATPGVLLAPPRPGDRYPPPAVRLALLGELAAHAGIAGGNDGNDDGAGEVSARQVREWLDGVEGVHPPVRATMRRLLAPVPDVAAALVDLPVAQGPGGSVTLRQAAGVDAGWFAPGGRVDRYAGQLRGATPVLTDRHRRAAARLVVAAGVRAARGGAEPGRVHANLLAVLPTCGGEGVLGPAPSGSDVVELADRLANRLLAEDLWEGTGDTDRPSEVTEENG